MVEDVWVAVLVHAIEESAELVEALGEELEGCCYGFGVVGSSGGNCVDEKGHQGPAAGLDGDGDEEDPRLVERASECC